MVSMHRPRIVLLGALATLAGCAGDAASDRSAPGAGARDAATVAASPPLPGFSADIPAGRVPGSTTPLPVAAGSAATPAASPPPAPGTSASTAPASSTPASTTPASPTPSSTTPANPATPANRGGATGSPGQGTTGRAGAGQAGGGQAASGIALAAGEISAATGVFTAAQANRGREVYTNTCANCHMASAHTGGTFASNWNGKRVFDLYDLLHSTMPLDAPGSLTAQQYADVVAYMLQLNGLPTGNAPLAPDPATLRKIRIEIRAGT